MTLHAGTQLGPHSRGADGGLWCLWTGVQLLALPCCISCRPAWCWSMSLRLRVYKGVYCSLFARSLRSWAHCAVTKSSRKVWDSLALAFANWPRMQPFAPS